VTDGKVTLDVSASKVHVGYGYRSTLETLRMESGADDGIAQGKIKRIHGVTALCVWNLAQMMALHRARLNVFMA